MPINNYNAVGPVLIASNITNKIVAAIKTLNKNVVIQDHGSYVRVLCASQCILTKEAIQEQTNLPFILPDDLELIMPSFKGIFTVSEHEAKWTFQSSSDENY